MTWRKTAITWALFAIVGSIAWWTGTPGSADPTPKKVAEEVLVPIFEDEVTAISITRGGRKIRAERNEKRWVVVTPEGAFAPSDLMAALVASLTDEQQSIVVAESPDSDALEGFGLGASDEAVILESTKEEPVSVEFGTLNPPRTAVYARTDRSPKVFLAGLNLQYYADLLFEAAFPDLKNQPSAEPEDDPSPPAAEA